MKRIELQNNAITDMTDADIGAGSSNFVDDGGAAAAVGGGGMDRAVMTGTPSLLWLNLSGNKLKSVAGALRDVPIRNLMLDHNQLKHPAFAPLLRGPTPLAQAALGTNLKVMVNVRIG